MRHTVVILAAALLSACASAPAAPAEGVISTETLQHAGRARTYQVHDFSGGKRAPVVIVMHGGGGNAANAVMMTRFDVVARRERFIAVYPDGSSGPLAPNLETWNAGHCCAQAMRNKVDDVGFLSAMIDKLVAAGKADPKRVYATGMSNGGMMSHRLAIELSDKIAAVAPVVGALFGDEKDPPRAVPILIINGADDRIVPAEGGRLSPGASTIAAGSEDHPLAPSRAQGEYWARAAGCRAGVTRAVPGASLTEYPGCRGGVEVLHYTVANNGHAWPGGNPGREGANVPTKDFNASEVIWAFFKKHPKR
jgi:polyhydroxybutyrate depolymerase